ncbi:MAG TPA: MogA/MoaB family molybdenum cofactor biosynthesis protein [bacterium]|nr:MogA/MoaB family molybdenum cofactor biosynthesis protein [bacterium]
MIKVGILVISDKASRGERKDESGPAIRKIISKLPPKSRPSARGGQTPTGQAIYQVIKYEIIPDEKEIICRRLKEWVDKDSIDLILTSGGTGIGPRDVTPEATKEVIEKEVPGFVEAMRIKGLEKTPFSMLSRAIVGTRKKSLIVNLPGSPKAVRENLEVILPALKHGIEILKGETGECGR